MIQLSKNDAETTDSAKEKTDDPLRLKVRRVKTNVRGGICTWHNTFWSRQNPDLCD